MHGRITEVFNSVQGEGLYLGEEQVFVRFFGCNLDCKFCDTKPNSFLRYEPQELFEEIKLYENDLHSVSFTGGEPLLQNDFLKEVLKLTRRHGYRNYLETNGTLYYELEEVIDYLDYIAMDLKLPSSTGFGTFWNIHKRFLKVACQKEVFLKAIICESSQEKDLRQALRLIKEINPDTILVLQPNNLDDYTKLQTKLENFRDICIREGITACIIPQMHKVMGIR